jgi:hypothetical protein
MSRIVVTPAMAKLALETAIELVKAASRTYGKVHKAWPARMNGTDGLLIWDYIVWNEITFKATESGDISSLFTSVSDTETEARFNELVQEFGVPGDRLMKEGR